MSFKHISSELSGGMVPCVQAVGKYICDNSYVIKRKKYNSILVIFTTDGQGCLKYKNQKYTTRKGEGFIINCNEPHVYFTGETGEWKFQWVHFKGEQSFNQVNYILDHHGPFYRDEVNGLINKKIRLMIDIAANKGVYYDILLSGYLNDIMTHLMLKTIEQNSKNIIIPPIVLNAIDMIESHYANTIGLDALAKKLFVNKYYLIRIFKRYMGITPYEYLIKYRLNQAKSLLESSSLSITEIAFSVGFSDSSYFIKVFKQHEDTTPLSYRKYWSSLQN
ncbi:AraC family transcriptional regulator [Vallitalea okinawensis]|uniref:AraC family transcriptional regulator n=1 Tax=Vallitalea okinawensis TaxID=2078660 RepID=UPI000CFE1702|nr:AraC family transcriptional regulator [Vallitalea okinawensis]